MMKRPPSIALMMLSIPGLASSVWAVDRLVPGTYSTIQSAIDAASVGDRIVVADGTYNENVNLNKAVILVSEHGRDATTIQGSAAQSTAAGGGNVATVCVSVNGAAIGTSIGDGFTIRGYDWAAPAIEHAAIYITGGATGNLSFIGNHIIADGEGGLLGQYGGLTTGNVEISYNLFSGQTYVGSTIGGNSSVQFDVHNVPRSMVYFGGNNVDIHFHHNSLSGSVGGLIQGSDPAQYYYNTGATLDCNGASSLTNGAVIENNLFTIPTWASLRARGNFSTVTDNVFDCSVSGAFVGAYYQNQATGVFSNNLRTMVAGMTVQQAVDAAFSGDVVEILPGTYSEQVVIAKSIHLRSEAGQTTTTIIQAPATFPVASDPLSNIVLVSGAGVSAEISGLTIQGPGPTGCGSIARGIFVRDGAYANIHDNRILDVRDNALPVSGCQNGIAIQVGRQALSTAGTALIANNLIQGHQKGAIVVDNTGSSATITGNTITGAGTISITAQNGIQISRGANATLTGNIVSGHSYHVDGSQWDWGACGLLLYQSGAVALTGGNTFTGNDNQYYAYGGITGALTLGAETFGPSPAPVNSGYYVVIDEPQDLDLTACTFEGVTPGTASLAQLFAIEERIWHGLDEAGLGLARVLAGQLFVAADGTIQTAVDAADPVDVVHVAAGTYNENVTLNKRLTLDGAGPALTIIQSAAATTPVLQVTASGLDATNRLVVRDLKVTGATGGENPGAGILVQSTSPQSFLTFDGLSATGNQGGGIAFNTTAAVSDVVISNSSLSNNGNGLRIATAVPSFDGLAVSGCQMNNNASSAFTYNPSGNLANVGTNFSFTNCSFTNNSTAGVTNQHDLSFFGFHGNATLTNVTVNSGNGVGPNSNSYGISFTNQSIFAPSGSVVLNGVTCTGHVGKAALGFQYYSDVNPISLTNVNVEACSAPWGQLVVYHNDSDPFPVGNTVLRDLRMWWSGGADATAADFRHFTTGVPLNRAVLTDAFQISSQVLDGVDVAGLGLIRIKTGDMYVTAGTSIQRAVDLATINDRVNVAAGTYDEDVTVTKTLHLQGAGAGLSTVRGPIGGGGSTFRLDANNVELDGFTITRLGNNPADWNNTDLNSAGIAIQSAFTGANIHHNTLSGNRTGIDLNNTSGHNVHDNTITDNRTGMVLRNQTDNLLVTNNAITNNWTVGIVFLDASSGSNVPLQQALGCSFSNNNLSGNWYGQVVERQTGGSLPLPGTTNLKNFPSNWWGTPAPVVSTSNSTEPGYSSQIPVAYGGTATAPGGQPDILGPASANIQYLPALTYWGSPTVTILQAADQPLISVADNGAPYPATTNLTVGASAATTPWRGLSVEVVYDPTYLQYSGFEALFTTHPDPNNNVVNTCTLDSPGHLLLDVSIGGGMSAVWSAATDLFRVTFDAIAQPASPFTTPLHLGTVLVRDVLNNPLSYDRDTDETITIDGTAPGTLTAVRAPAGALITANPSWTVTAVDNYLLGKVEQKVDLAAWSLLAGAIELASWSGTAGPYGLLDGVHTVSFQTRDKAGNLTGPLADTFTLDTTPPSLFEFVNQPANCVNSQPTWTLHGVDNILLGSVWMTINGGTATQVATMNAADWTGVVGPFGFADGSYTVVFTLKDTAGHTCATTLTDTFTLDTNAPTAPSGLDAVPAPNGCILTWTPGSEMSGYTLYWKKRAGYPYPNGLQTYAAWNGAIGTEDGSVNLGLVNTYPFTTANDFASRGVYDFRLAATDCVNNPALSGMASATNYYLGDVWQPYDGKVFTPDLVNVMSLVYGTVPTTNPGMEMNVGPTHDHSSYGLPAWGVTNARVNFEDLIIFSMNYGMNGPTLPISSFGVTGTPVVTLHTTQDGAQLTLDGQLKGFSSRINSNATLQSATADFPVFFYRDGDAWVVDAVSLGGNLVSGSTIQLSFDRATAPELIAVDGRDARNSVVLVDMVNGGALPNSFALEQNFPNPFNPVTTIRYALPEAASVKLAVYNALGQEVMVLVDSYREAGFHEARLDGSGLASGVYIYRLEAGSFTDHKKLVLVK